MKKILEITAIVFAACLCILLYSYIISEVIGVLRLYVSEQTVSEENNNSGEYNESLYDLCKLSVSQKDTKKAVKYIPILLDNEDLLYSISREECILEDGDRDYLIKARVDNGVTSDEELYDYFQSYYLMALLCSGKRDEFNNEFLSRIPDFKTERFIYSCFIIHMNSFGSKLSNEDLEVFAETLKTAYETYNLSDYSKICILGIQIVLYDECGNTEKMKEAQVLAGELINPDYSEEDAEITEAVDDQLIE